MKIKVTEKAYDDVMSMPDEKHFRPVKQTKAARLLLKIASRGEMKAVSFTYTMKDMEKLGREEPCMILMNHSSFTDLQIIATVFSDRQYHIVCTNDGFVGKAQIMRHIGCIPAKKFISDPVLIRDMKYAFDELKSSVVMYPEASYSFDGTETPLPESTGKLLKLMKVPVIMVRTKGAFGRDPLYNNLQKRKVKVSAEIKYLFSAEDIKKKSAEELNDVLNREFSYDHFREQHDSGTVIDEPFRADGLHRALYKCHDCGSEGTMKGEGTRITCSACGLTHELREDGTLEAEDHETKFAYVPDWYRWEREEVRKEILSGTYRTELPVDILIYRDMKTMYKVGEGTLVHDNNGFALTGCDGKLNYTQSPRASYSLYADYFWYEIGDMISIGDGKIQYYCFPKESDKAIVAKARLAAEEMYKICREGKIV